MKARRNTYLIDRKVQMRFTLYFVLVAFAGNIAAVILFNMLAIQQLDTVMWSTHISLSSTDELIQPLFIYINIAGFAFVTLLLFLTGLWMLRKTSGPLYRMSKDIHMVAEGDLSLRIALRQKDEFKDVADELNSMLDGLRTNFSGIKDKYARVSRSLDLLRQVDCSKEEQMKNFNALVENIKDVKAETDKFEL